MKVKSPSKYKNVYAVLQDRILSGVWPVGCQIPSEVELSTEFACSRSTVGAAMANLVHEGLVERRTRAGTRVLANTLNSRKTSVDLDAFALLYPSDKHENIWKVAQGFQGEANIQQRRSVMFATGPDFRKEAEIITRLAEFDIRGAAIYPMVSCPEEELALLQMISASKFPLVLIGGPLFGCVCPTVEVDGFHIGFTMAMHLIETGSTRIGFFTNNSSEPSRRAMYKGYLWALEQAGLPVEKEWIFLKVSMHADFDNPLREPTDFGHAYLTAAKGVESVVCGDDHLALGLMQAARERGLSIPDDLRITGCDDLLLASTSRPPLTTYRISAEAVGRSAFQLLNDSVNSPADAPQSVCVRGSLIVRESTAISNQCAKAKPLHPEPTQTDKAIDCNQPPISDLAGRS